MNFNNYYNHGYTQYSRDFNKTNNKIEIINKKEITKSTPFCRIHGEDYMKLVSLPEKHKDKNIELWECFYMVIPSHHCGLYFVN